MAEIDIITAEILRNKFMAAGEDMRATLVNTAYSAAISESKECANGLFTESGLLVATDNAVHMGSLAATAATILDDFQFDMTGEDLIITNDPYSGGTHVRDFTILSPLTHEDTIVLYLAVRAHLADIGGEFLGGVNPKATEIWAEGARITPIKLVRDGKLQKDVLATVLLNSRAPDAFKLDLDAMIAAIEVGKRRLTELIQRYGINAVLHAMDWAVEYADRRFGAELANWPAGEYEGLSVLAHDGHGRQELAVRVRVKVDQGRLELDFSATDPQSAGFVNSTVANTYGYALLPILSVVDESVPKNAGILRRVKLITKKGTLVDPEFPAPTGWSPHHTGAEISDAVVEALAQFLSDRVGNTAANMLMAHTIERAVRHGGTIEQIDLRDYALLSQGGCSGTKGRDGWGMPGIFAESPLPSVELYEAQFGGFILKLEYVPDSGGAGTWRGGLGTETVIRFPSHADDLYLSVCLEALESATGGFAGGKPGAGNAAWLIVDGEPRVVRRCLIREQLKPGAELRLQMGGGAGWGPPWERDPALVLDEVLNGYVTPDGAVRDYGVVIDPDHLVIKKQATEKAREQITKSA
jgi:N-methylhydantoinase B